MVPPKYLDPLKGLFFSDVKDDVRHIFTNTVYSNKSKFVHSLQEIIGQPSPADFIIYKERNMIPYCPIT